MKILDYILDFIWPRFCLSCKKEGSLCCAQCQKKIELLDISYQAWPDEEKFIFEKCYVCLDFQQIFTQKLIKTFKYQYIQELSTVLSDILYRQSQKINLPANTIISNIPLHLKKKKQRGFDQTEVLAKNLSQKINLPYQKLLKRIKFNKTQARLNKAERLLNVENIFTNTQKMCDSEAACVLLIDDIATTGATLNEAARVLKLAGYSHIIALVLAKN